MTDNCTCDCCIYSLSSELLLLLGLFCLDGLQFSLYISVKKSRLNLWLFHFFLLSFMQFSRLLVVALASQGSQVLLFFGNYLICLLSLFYEYLFHLLSILFVLIFLLLFCTNSFLHQVLDFNSHISFSKFSSVNPTSPSYSLNWFVDYIFKQWTYIQGTCHHVWLV